MRRFPALAVLLFCAACTPHPRRERPSPQQARTPADSTTSQSQTVAAGAPVAPDWQLLRLGAPRVGHTAPLVALAWAPDGARFCSSATDNTLRVWDAMTGDELLRIRLSARVLGSCFSADGQTLLAFSGRQVFLWDALSGAELGGFDAQTPIVCSAWAADGRLALGCEGGALELWHAPTGRRLARQQEAHAGTIYSLAWADDGRLASGGSDGQLRLWSGPLEPQGRVAVAGEKVMALAWAEDGRLAAGTDKDTAQIFSGALELLQSDRGSATWWVAGLWFSPDGLWVQPLNAGVRLLTAAGSRDLALGGDPLAFSPDGRNVLEADPYGAIRRWQTDPLEPLPFPREASLDVVALALTRDGSQLVSAQDEGQLRVYSCEDGSLLAERREHHNGVWSLSWGEAVEHEGRWLPVMHSHAVDLDAVWRVGSWELHSSSHKGLPRNYVPAPEDRDLLDARALLAGDERLCSARFSSDRRLLAAGYQDGQVELWDVPRGARLFSQRLHAGPVHLLAFDRDAERLASAGREGCLGVYDLTGLRETAGP